MRKLTIVVPVYNEAKTVRGVYSKLKSFSLGVAYEVIFVDDGSTDGSTNILKWLSRNSARKYKFMFLKKNSGKGSAIRKGLKEATGDYFIVQDADNEYDPRDIAKLVKKVERSGNLAVYGSRNSTVKNKYIYKHYYLGNQMLSLGIWLLYGQKLTDPETCYKMVNTNLMRFLDLNEDGFGIEMEVTLKLRKLGVRIAEVPISYKPRSYREGKKLQFQDGLHAAYMLLKLMFFDLHYGSPVDRMLRWIRVREALSVAGSLQGKSLLDVGSGGQAYLGWRVRNKVSNYISLDPDLGEYSILNIEMVKGRAENMTRKLKSRKFDTIVALALIEHLDDPQKFLRDCLSLLKDNGRLVLTTPHPNSDLFLKIMAKLRLIDGREIEEHKTYFDSGNMLEAMEKAGLRLVKEKTFELGLNAVYLARKSEK